MTLRFCCVQGELRKKAESAASFQATVTELNGQAERQTKEVAGLKLGLGKAEAKAAELEKTLAGEVRRRDPAN